MARGLGLPVHVPKPARTIETPDHMLKMHQLMVAVAKRGGGKSVLLTSFLRHLEQHKLLDRLFLISPTFESNKNYFEGLPLAPEDIYHEPDPGAIHDIISKMDAEQAEYAAYQEKAAVWRKWLAALRKHRGDVDAVPAELMLEVERLGLLDAGLPPAKYGGRRPTCALFMDDVQCTGLFNSKVFLSLCLRHRHVSQGLGLTILIACQNYKSIQGGLPLAIRDNCTCLLLGRTKNERVLDSIAEECGDLFSKEQFLDVYHRATDGDHNFLCVDFNPKSPNKTFRKNFDEYLVPGDSTAS